MGRHTPDYMTKLILRNFLEAHVDRVDVANESTRDTHWSMFINFNVLTYPYTPDCMTKLILVNFLETPSEGAGSDSPRRWKR